LCYNIYMMQPGISPEVSPQIPTKHTFDRGAFLIFLGKVGALVATKQLLGACAANSDPSTPTTTGETPPSYTEPVPTPPQAHPTTTTEQPAKPSPTTTEQPVPATTVEETAPPTETEVERPIRPFAHEELVPANLTFRISSTDETINLPLHAFTDPGDSLNDGEILGSGGIVVTGDVDPEDKNKVIGYPYNVLGIHEPHVDENGNIRPMVVGYHRTTYPAALINVTKIRVNDGPNGEADILEYEYDSPDGKQKLRFKAVRMHIVQDGDGATLSGILKPTLKQRVFIFACTEFNSSSQAAVEAANNGTNDVEDSYPTDPDKNPNARILVEYELIEDTPLTHQPL
jgi:hypothetical protein